MKISNFSDDDTVGWFTKSFGMHPFFSKNLNVPNGYKFFQFIHYVGVAFLIKLKDAKIDFEVMF
jgi:hypothetical protein